MQEFYRIGLILKTRYQNVCAIDFWNYIDKKMIQWDICSFVIIKSIVVYCKSRLTQARRSYWMKFIRSKAHMFQVSIILVPQPFIHQFIIAP